MPYLGSIGFLENPEVVIHELVAEFADHSPRSGLAFSEADADGLSDVALSRQKLGKSFVPFLLVGGADTAALQTSEDMSEG